MAVARLAPLCMARQHGASFKNTYSVGSAFLAWKVLWGVRSASLLTSLPSLMVAAMVAEY